MEEPTAEHIFDEHQHAAHTIPEWKGKVIEILWCFCCDTVDWEGKKNFSQILTFNFNSFVIIIIVSAIIWHMVEEFLAPSWVNDDPSDD